MAFEPIIPQKAGNEAALSQDEFIKSLPWADKLPKAEILANKPTKVVAIREYLKGMMIVTSFYKAYVKLDDPMHSFLEEAMQVWKKRENDSPMLMCQLNRKGYPVIGIDQEQPRCFWFNSENNWTQIEKKPEEPSKNSTSTNPLLTDSGEATKRARGGKG